ncbi:hypothetical protein [Dermabacter hominis]|uniref:hypothetical protein n=1 Tax=Dermabacter hominis TaxID=36740 RepID=UPI00242B1671|nr:hypothetical protein [Dermabacter hominis]
MAKNRNTALRRRLGGAVVGASVLVSGFALSGAVSFEPLAAFAADTTCTPGTAVLSAKKVEKGKEFTALVCGLEEGTEVRGEYRKVPSSVASEATPTPGASETAPTPDDANPEETTQVGYTDTATVGPDGRATVAFTIAEPGTYALTIAPLEGGTASKAQVEITDQPPDTTDPTQPSEPTPSPSTTPTEPSPEEPDPSPTQKPPTTPPDEPANHPEPRPTVSPTRDPEPSERPTTEPSKSATPSPADSSSPLPGTGASSSVEPSEHPRENSYTTSPGNDSEKGDSSTEAGGSYFVRPETARMSRIPARGGHGRSADFGAVGSDYSKLAREGGVTTPGPTPGLNPSNPEDESTEGSTQLITDPSRQPLGLSVAWLIGGVIAGLGLAATGAIVLMRRNG